MNTRRRISFVYSLLSVVGVLLSSTPSIGQPAPDPSLWRPVFNPSGQRVVPVLFYDSTTGILGIDTRGLNRLDDTPDFAFPGGPIGYDDVAFFAFEIQTNVSTGIFFPPFTGFDPIQFLVWTSGYDGGRYRLNANGLGNVFLWPAVYPMIQLPPNLTSNQFFTTEIVVAFGPQLPFNLLLPTQGSNGIQIVPEPSIECLSIAVSLCLLCRVKSSFKEDLARVFRKRKMLCLPK